MLRKIIVIDEEEFVPLCDGFWEKELLQTMPPKGGNDERYFSWWQSRIHTIRLWKVLTSAEPIWSNAKFKHVLYAEKWTVLKIVTVGNKDR